MIDVEKLSKLIAEKNWDELQDFIKTHNLKIRDGKLYHSDAQSITQQIEFYDKRQLVKKLALNGAYGSLLNQHCRFHDARLGQSTTLSGRVVTRHMNAFINQCVSGEYDYTGDAIIYSDTDSVASDSVILTSEGSNTIEDLFLSGTRFWKQGDKEYSVNPQIQVAVYSNQQSGPVQMGSYNYVYRHKTNKRRFRLTTALQNQVVVTEDHSVIVLENDTLIEKKPQEVQANSQVLTLNSQNAYVIDYITQVEELTPFNDEYVYDIGVSNHNPYFFANNIMVHNSCYFSVWPLIKAEVESGNMTWNKEVCIGLYDTLAEQVNASFPAFCESAFHTPPKRGEVIRSGRELVSTRGIYITKKRYAVMIYDLEGRRQDLDGKPGKLKAMGLDLKRSDTPKFMQDFLKEILEMLLTGGEQTDIINRIREFKTEFKKRPAWEKGTPKRVNKLTYYGELEKKQGKTNMPGHVRASLNWNHLRYLNDDHHSMKITDGMKVVVCKLKSNVFNFTSVAFPVDENRLPEWFKILPFDNALMEETIIDAKIQNLLGVLNWDLHTTATSIFTRWF